MALPVYLAMTAAEFHTSQSLTTRMAWMACHFSPYGTGLSHLPPQLPQDSAVIINDRTPFFHHDLEYITCQIIQLLAEQPGIRCVLLDLQRPNQEAYALLAKQLSQSLPCPVGISACCADGLDCPVFLPPIPVDQPARSYLAAYRGREIWLELSYSPTKFTITSHGTVISPSIMIPGDGHSDQALCCHYRQQTEKEPEFTVWRTADDLAALTSQVSALGVTRCFGLYQELGIELQKI